MSSASSAKPPAGERTRGRTNDTREHLLALLAPVVAATGHDLEDLTVTSAGRRSLVRVIVDSDTGVDLDAVAEVSRAVSAALDDDAPGGAAFAGPFVLEVSSPGVDRPLSDPRHWRRAVGRLVSVPVGDTTVSGRVVETSGQGVTLDEDGRRREVAWHELGPGRVKVEFNRIDTGQRATESATDAEDDTEGDTEYDTTDAGEL